MGNKVRKRGTRVVEDRPGLSEDTVAGGEVSGRRPLRLENRPENLKRGLTGGTTVREGGDRSRTLIMV